MRRFFGFLLTMTLLGGGAFWLPYLQAKPVDNVYQAADLLRQDAENGGNGVAFREDNVDADEVYRALEAQYPYAFALHAVTRPNKTIELNTEVSRQARQEQAWEYAQGADSWFDLTDHDGRGETACAARYPHPSV